MDISHGRKFPAVGDTKALDLKATLKEFLPESAFAKPAGEQNGSNRLASTVDWCPPGLMTHTYEKDGRSFEIWTGTLLDPRVNALVNNIQSLVLFFIEAGSLLNLREADWSLDRWKVYFVYEKLSDSDPSVSPYVLVGYATTYRFWHYVHSDDKLFAKQDSLEELPAISPLQLPARVRISQFIILPPWQGSGHGSQLFETIRSSIGRDPTVSELTVEDPSEEFDRLRDSCDWRIIRPRLRASKIIINTTKPSTIRRIARVPTSILLDLDALKLIRQATKIAPRQFSRQLEMYLLAQIPFSHRSAGGANLTKLKLQKHTNKDEHDRTYYWWRILLKQRIYRRNRDVLIEADPEEKYTQIEDSARGQEDEYEGLLMGFALKQEERDGKPSVQPSSGSTVRKRKAVVEDDDEEEGDEETRSKRAKS